MARTLNVLLALTLVHAPAAQEAPIFRVGADLVVIDMVALDRDGRFVDDLRPGELELREDGDVRPVQFLERVGRGARPIGDGAASPAPTAGPPAAPGAPATSLPSAPPDTSLVVAIDTLSLPVEAFPRGTTLPATASARPRTSTWRYGRRARL
jgi:hypothetical protein